MAAKDSERLRHLAAIIRAELAIERATNKAFKAWLPAVRDAILYGKAPAVPDSLQDPAPLTAAAGDDEDNAPVVLLINPGAAEITRKLWEFLAAGIVLEIVRVYAQQVRRTLPDITPSGLAVMQESYAATVRSRLNALPDEIFVRVQEIVSQGIREGLTNEQLARRIRDALSPLKPEFKQQAKVVGRTEGIGVYNGAIHQAHLLLSQQTGQAFTKEWLTVRDPRVRHTHATAAGQTVALAAKFNVGGFVADYPGDPRLPAREAVNCRCVARYAAVLTNGAKMTPIVASIEDADGRLPNGWRGRMAPLTKPTGDGRQLNVPEGGVRTRELPIAFDWAPSREGGHDGAVMAGRIDYVWIEEFEGVDYLMGEGAIDVGGQAGAEYARQLAEGFAMFVSVDPDEVTFETQFFNGDGEQVPFNEAVMVGDGQESLKEGYTVLDVMTDWRLAGVTAVTIPAFQEARIEPVYDYVPRKHYIQAADLPSASELADQLDAFEGDDDAELAELARKMKRRRHYEAIEAATDETEIVATVVGSLSFPVFADRKRKWDGHAARQNVAKWASSDGSGSPDKINFKKFSSAFLFRGAPQSGNALLADKAKGKSSTFNVEDFKGGYVDIIEGKPYIVANAVIGLAGGHGIQAMDVPGAEKKAMLGKLKTLYGKMKSKFPDFPDFPFSNTGEPMLMAALTAAAGQVFAAESFADPRLSGPTPLTVDGGRVYGHVALFDSCYMAQGGARACIKPPRENDYSRFLSHGARLADGSIQAVGVITFGEGHFAGGSLRASMANYANMATAAAKVSMGEDEWGVWVAGEVLDAFADKADDLLLSPLSGHWEPDQDRGGALTIIAAHVVVAPGFHVPRLVATMGADGMVESALIAGPFTFLEKSAELFDAAVASGEIEASGEREDGVTLYKESEVVAAVYADRRAQAARRRLGLDADSRAGAALARMGVRE